MNEKQRIKKIKKADTELGEDGECRAKCTETVRIKITLCLNALKVKLSKFTYITTLPRVIA